MRKMVALTLALGLAAAAPPTHAWQAQGDAKKESKDRKEEKKAADAGLVADAGGDAGPKPDVLPKPPERPKDRAERRRLEVARTRATWGALVRDPRAKVELRIHAMRVAKLDAMERVAKDSGKATLVGRIQKLRERETARHEKRMAAIRDEPDTKDGG